MGMGYLIRIIIFYSRICRIIFSTLRDQQTCLKAVLISFMQINENLNDKNKVMISMSNSEAVDWLYNIKVPCKYINLLDQDEDILIENIYQELVGAC